MRRHFLVSIEGQLLWAAQSCGCRHSRSDRDLYLVSVWRNHYRRCCIRTPNCHCLRCRHTACRFACDVHVKHAICVQVCCYLSSICLLVVSYVGLRYWGALGVLYASQRSVLLWTVALILWMLYSSFEHDSFLLLSILYKTKLPFIIVFNKTDVQPHAFALEWMQDFEVFQEALATHQSTTDDDGAPTYMNSLMNSMSLVLDEFYKHIKVGLRIFAFSPPELTFPVSRRIQCDRRWYRRVLPGSRGFT